ncbi:MAG: hypothetical protein OXR72_03225 [Gemmatimonadota bacterium]|nr:hypothetical protein [Gemmatimonadota bacterium]
MRQKSTEINRKYENFSANSNGFSYCIIAILLERYQEHGSHALCVDFGQHDSKPHNGQEVQNVPGRHAENGYSGTEIAMAEARDHRFASFVSLHGFTGLEYGVEMVQAVATREPAGSGIICGPVFGRRHFEMGAVT